MPILPVSTSSRFRALYVCATFASLAAGAVALLVTRRWERQRFARRVRIAFERLGGLWIKAGQLLALRIDIFPEELCRELSRLQSRALGFPGSVARRMVEEELGAPIDQYFDEWEDAPFAAASIGQVHRARLRQEQVRVAVKVQKPHSVELFERDLRVIEWFVRLVTLLRLYPHMRWNDGLFELRAIMREELDFGFEAASTRRMRKNLRAHGVYVPKVFSRYCGARVFVTEFIPMVLMADYLRVAQQDAPTLHQWARENGIVPRRVARRLVHSFQRQMLEDNLYHGDMHPGNIGLLRDNRIVLIDFGTTNFTEGEYLQKFRLFMRAMAIGDYAKAADMCLMLCAILPAVDMPRVHAKALRVIQSWAARTLVRELPFHDKSMDNLTMEVMTVLLGFKCTMEWAWLRLHRASSTLDASLIELHPGIDYRKVTSQYFEAAEKRRARSAIELPAVRRAIKGRAVAQQIVARVPEYAMLQGALVRRQIQVFRRFSSRTAHGLAAGLAVTRLLIVGQGAVMLALAWPGFGDTFRRLLHVALPPAPAPLVDPQVLAIVLIVDVLFLSSVSRLYRQLTDDRVSHRDPAGATS